MAPFTAGQHHFRNLLQRQIRPAFCCLGGSDAMKGRTTNQQALVATHLIGKRLQLLCGKILRRDINEIALAGMAVLPPLNFGWCVGKTFQLSKRLGQLCGVVFRVDDRIVPAVVDDQAGSETIVTEATATLPANLPKLRTLTGLFKIFWNKRK